MYYIYVVENIFNIRNILMKGDNSKETTCSEREARRNWRNNIENTEACTVRKALICCNNVIEYD